MNDPVNIHRCMNKGVFFGFEGEIPLRISTGQCGTSAEMTAYPLKPAAWQGGDTDNPQRSTSTTSRSLVRDRAGVLNYG